MSHDEWFAAKNITDIKVDGIFVTEASDQSIVTHELRIKSVPTFRSKREEMISECNEWFVSKAVHHVRLFVWIWTMDWLSDASMV